MYPIIRQDIALSTTLVSQHHEAELQRQWSNASDISGHGEVALLLALPSFVVPNFPKSKPICKKLKRNHLNLGWDGKEVQTSSSSRSFPFVPHARIRNNVETEISSAWPHERKEANLCPDWREPHGRVRAEPGGMMWWLGPAFQAGNGAKDSCQLRLVCLFWSWWRHVLLRMWLEAEKTPVNHMGFQQLTKLFLTGGERKQRWPHGGELDWGVDQILSWLKVGNKKDPSKGEAVFLSCSASRSQAEEGEEPFSPVGNDFSSRKLRPWLHIRFLSILKTRAQEVWLAAQRCQQGALPCPLLWEVCLLATVASGI